MATKTVIVDDLDGSEATRTVEFGFNGTSYEIDLSDANATKLEKALATFVEHARKAASGTKRRSAGGVPRSGSTPAQREENNAIRAWWRGQGNNIADKGRINDEIREAYRAAQAGGGSTDVNRAPATKATGEVGSKPVAVAKPVSNKPKDASTA